MCLKGNSLGYFATAVEAAVSVATFMKENGGEEEGEKGSEEEREAAATRAAAAAAAEGSVLEEFDGVSLLLSAKSTTGASYLQ